MAVGMVMQFRGLGEEQYEAVMRQLGLTSNRGDWPAGIISHVAGPTPDGWCVVDVWEAREQFDAFLRDRLRPAFDAVGGLPQPVVTFFRVHNAYRRG